MPDNEQTVTETPESEPTTAEIFKSALDADEPDESQEPEESEDATAEGGETEEEEEDGEDVEADSSEDPDEDEDEEDDYLALDPSVAEKLPEEAKKRYEQQVKGVQKIKRQLAEREAAVRMDETGYNAYQSWASALSSPEHAQQAYQKLGEKLSETFGWELGTQTESEGEYVFNGVQYLSDTEVRLAKEIHELKTKGFDDPDLAEIKAEHARRKEAQSRESWVKSNSQAIIAKVQGKTGGWGVTKDQIAQAYEINPEGMVKKPVETLKAMNPDSYAEWYAGKKAKRDVPDLVTGTDSKGLDLPKDKNEWSMLDHARAIGIVS